MRHSDENKRHRVEINTTFLQRYPINNTNTRCQSKKRSKCLLEQTPQRLSSWHALGMSACRRAMLRGVMKTKFSLSAAHEKQSRQVLAAIAPAAYLLTCFSTDVALLCSLHTNSAAATVLFFFALGQFFFESRN